jgi:hypothetical protein
VILVGIKPRREGRRTVAFDVVERTVDVITSADGVTLYVEPMGSRKTLSSCLVADFGTVKAARSAAETDALYCARVLGAEYGGTL